MYPQSNQAPAQKHHWVSWVILGVWCWVLGNLLGCWRVGVEEMHGVWQLFHHLWHSWLLKCLVVGSYPLPALLVQLALLASPGQVGCWLHPS